LRPIRGPSAFGGDLRRFADLTWMLATTEFKLRYFGSVLGYAWQLLRPLMLFGVLYAIFTQVVKFGAADIEHYPVYLLMALVVFLGFSEATSTSVRAVVEREALVRKVQFPRMVIPLSIVLTSVFNLCLNFVVVFVFALIAGVEVRLTWLLAPLLLVPLVVLATGVSMLLSALFVRFRDVGPVWEVLLQVGFYATPIFYAYEVIPENVRELPYFSPIAAIIEQLRHWVIDPDAATAAEAIGGGWLLLVPIGSVAGLFLLGLWVFDRMAPHVAEEL
jgi:ABC-2 type transport system permease protein